MNTTRDVIERYQQKIQVFRKLREFRHSLQHAGLLRNKHAKCSVLEVETMWIALFGTTAVSCDILQFLHALDTSGGWGKEMSLKDKALFFKLVAAKNGECSFQTFLESPLCFVPYVPNASTIAPHRSLIADSADLEQVVQDVARSIVYRKVDLLRLDMFSSGYVSAEEIQIVTPKLYPLHLVKAAVLELLQSFCEKNNIVLAETTMDLSFNQKAKGQTRVLPSDGPWFLRYIIQSCELFDRRLVFHKYLRDPSFQDIYKQIQNAPVEDDANEADVDPASLAGDSDLKRPKMGKEAGNMLFLTSNVEQPDDPLIQHLQQAEELWLQDALDTNRTEQSFRDFVMDERGMKMLQQRFRMTDNELARFCGTRGDEGLGSSSSSSSAASSSGAVNAPTAGGYRSGDVRDMLRAALLPGEEAADGRGASSGAPRAPPPDEKESEPLFRFDKRLQTYVPVNK